MSTLFFFTLVIVKIYINGYFLPSLHSTLIRPPTLKHKTTYLSINPERASLLIEVNGTDPWNFPCLLDVAAMAADGQAHQIRSHHELLLEGRHQLPGALHKHKSKVGRYNVSKSYDIIKKVLNI